MSNYAKMFAAVVATVLSALVAVMSDGSISNVEWINVGIAAVTAAAVFAAPNVPFANYTKSVLAVLMAVLTFFTTAISNGVTTSEWLQVAVIALGALGVYAVPNKTSQ
jgi:chromate transport protein ChrA